MQRAQSIKIPPLARIEEIRRSPKTPWGNPVHFQAASLNPGCRLVGIVDFGDNICKPGWFLGHHVYKNQTEDGDRNHHVNNAQNNDKNEGFGLNAHLLEFPCWFGLG